MAEPDIEKLCERLEAAAKDAIDDQEFDASQAGDGDRPDLWDGAEIELPAADVITLITALRSVHARAVKAEEERDEARAVAGYPDAVKSIAALRSDEIEGLRKKWPQVVHTMLAAEREAADAEARALAAEAALADAQAAVKVLREAMEEGVTALDAAGAACPINNGSAKSSGDCPKCGASHAQNCGPNISALGRMEELVRAALAQAASYGEGE